MLTKLRLQSPSLRHVRVTILDDSIFELNINSDPFIIYQMVITARVVFNFKFINNS